MLNFTQWKLTLGRNLLVNDKITASCHDKTDNKQSLSTNMPAKQYNCNYINLLLANNKLNELPCNPSYYLSQVLIHLCLLCIKSKSGIKYKIPCIFL